MKALTLRQPWATLVAVGAKRIETRSWSTNYRGPLAIHAAATRIRSGDIRHNRFPPEIRKALLPYACDRVAREWPGDLGKGVPADPWYLPLGAVVAIVELVDVVRIKDSAALAAGLILSPRERAFGDYTPGRFAWLLGAGYGLDDPIPARGALSLWEWDAPEPHRSRWPS